MYSGIYVYVCYFIISVPKEKNENDNVQVVDNQAKAVGPFYKVTPKGNKYFQQN